MTADDSARYVDYLDFTTFSWKRPEGPIRYWRVVDGLKKSSSGGDIPKFSIQEIPEELKEEVVDFLVTYLLPEEPACSSRGIGKDPLAVREFRTLWRDILNQGVSIVALVANPDPAVKPVIAGVNVLAVTSADDEKKAEGSTKNVFRTPSVRTIIGTLHSLTKGCEIFKRYGIDKYLAAYGLNVHPSFRGQGLGTELLKTRDDIGAAYQIPVSETVFTATVSQILAARVGFENLTEKDYDEIFDEEGKIAFPGINVKSMIAMAK